MSRSQRSADVRKQARAKLLQIRRERLGRRAGGTALAEAIAPEEEVFEHAVLPAVSDDTMADFATSDAPEPNNVFAEEEDPAAIDAVDESSDDTSKPEIAAAPPDESPSPEEVSFDSEAGEEEPGVEADNDETEFEAEVDAPEAGADNEDVPPEEELIEFADETPMEPTVTSEDTATVADPLMETATYDTDLDRIPGAGPGLVWMLWNASVRNLRDLAEADPDTLRAALGPVGKILDVDQLIELARNGADQAH